ncbi:slipin family protein [Chitinophaga vietnamensis]|uniref:slipin family protein n=1 Tax=Chitinophaga vietnamensis TaxID=2593957 RepID=UPI0011773569|nr:slipin family protein [Chitinophaga vietnamensis]
MKKVVVNAYERGLVFKRGVYQEMLKEGRYWFFGNEEVKIYDIYQPFNAPLELNALLQDAALAAALQVVNVGDNEIALQYENGLLQKVLTSGRYTYWKNTVDYKFVHIDISRIDIPAEIDPFILSSRLMAAYVRSYRVEEHEAGLLFIDAKFAKVLQPGIYQWWVNSTVINLQRVDMRQQQQEMNGQEILTKDKAALRINAWAQFRISDIARALLQNKDHEKQLYTLFQLALREYVGALTFDDLLDKKDTLSPFILEAVASKTAGLGISVQDFGIRDIVLPGDVKEIMNQVLIAEKKAQANIIMRREETASTRSLLNTARLMEDNPMLFKLKEMEYVEKIAEKINNISVNGNGVLIDQLRQIFISK